MAVSFKLYALKRKTKINGETPIYLRITRNRKYRYISTGVSVDLKDWNPRTEEVRKSHRNYRSLNLKLRSIKDEAQNKADDLDDSELTISNVKGAIVEKNAMNFLYYGESFIQKLESEENFFEAKLTKVVLRNLSAFMNSKQFEFGDLTTKKIYDFRDYLAKVQGNNPKTINSKMKRLRRIFKQAYTEQLIVSDPFILYRSLTENKVHKVRLSREQIETISRLNLTKDSAKYHTRNAFLFSFYNAGIRFGDLCQLRWSNIVDNNLVYRMSKTGTPKMIPLSKPASDILNLYKTKKAKKTDFIFPFLDGQESNSSLMDIKRLISSKNAYTNKMLKQLATMAGIQTNVSFHIARHSFADFARKSKMNLYDISKALGHSDIKVTEQYLESFDNQSLTESMESMFGKA
jgi:site-specific recombinase XerD